MRRMRMKTEEDGKDRRRVIEQSGWQRGGVVEVAAEVEMSASTAESTTCRYEKRAAAVATRVIMPEIR